ncbi:hypothetical protein OG693_39795 (plasmid) [Streptomyces sp. NBC_01259]|uniref:hypothetical protein n=1 Tax=Streptomyces sp. NBC_01259 TaxID=2903800 RepID=UPI002F906E88
MTTNPQQREGVPVLPAYIERRTRGVAGPPAMLLRVWCKWCCRWHEHGLGGSGVGDYTDRSAHCTAPDSPYTATGYHLLVTDTPFSAIRTAMKQATIRQRSAIRAGRISTAVQRLRNQPQPRG